MPSKDRLDKLVVLRGLAKSRELAKAYILEGKIFVDGKKVTKAGISVNEKAEISLLSEEMPYVSRGGLKLEAALHYFNLKVNGKIIMDVGCSTGGFTDCLLKMGAQKVYCIDVGYGQLAWSLRNDPRVIVMERTNVRYLDRTVKELKDSNSENGLKGSARIKPHEVGELIKGTLDMAVVDVSFISLKKVVPVLLAFLKEEADMILLVKPQFEVGKGEVGKGGIVREEAQRLKAVHSVKDKLEHRGLKTMGFFESPVPGPKGNIEYFLYMKKGKYGKR
jgi:23S rRNA (cytidine1920-2'-O)/16S rRNA (cytidine1409-2'-O)-methyltransferase